MSPWILVLVLATNNGTAAVTIDMPTGIICNRELEAYRREGRNFQAGRCVNRGVTQ